MSGASREFFEEAVLDADGTMAETTGQRKQGMDISHDGVWGYHPLLISLASAPWAQYATAIAMMTVMTSRTRCKPRRACIAPVTVWWQSS